MSIRTAACTTLLLLTACGTQLTDGSFGGTSSPVSPSNSNAIITPTPTTKAPTSTPPLSAVCQTTGFASGATPTAVAHETRSLLDLQQLLIVADPNGGAYTEDAVTTLKTNSGDSIYINNDTGANANFVAPGSTGTFTLSSANSALSSCAVCIQGMHNNNVYSVVSGTLQLTAPNGDGQSMEAQLHNLVLGHTNSAGTVELWCVGDLSAGTQSQHWSCDDLHLNGSPTCWNDSVGQQSLAMICSTQGFQNGDEVPVMINDCGHNGQTCQTQGGGSLPMCSYQPPNP